MTYLPRWSRSLFALTALLAGMIGSLSGSRLAAQAWPTHSHDAQHTGISAAGAQSLAKIHWSVPVDLAPPVGEIFIHYGSPVITAANTVIVPVKTGPDNFRVEAHDGASGGLLWMQNTGYFAPPAAFLPGIGPTLFQNTVLIPDDGGRIMVRQNPDLAAGGVSHLIFYGRSSFLANPSVYQQNVAISTPLTTDAEGNIYFGFAVFGPTPIGLQSGLARMGHNGVGTWVAATNLSGDPNTTRVAPSCAPALSNDGKTLYVTVKDSNDFGTGYLVALNSKTLAVINKVQLMDPAFGVTAIVPDETSASPTVGPDGDVYYGVLENPFLDHNDRGWLLHFNSDLSQQKIPGSFGWDDTASIVDASLVAGYNGKSKYLVMTKYNNYASLGTGNGHNQVAILDPNATQDDPVIPSTKVMRAVRTKEGLTLDPDFPTFPGAVREWCINTAAVDPITKAVIVNSEDGKLYRWDLTTNTLSQRIKLSGGIGEAYTPTVIGPDGTVYAINDAVLDAVGN